MGGDQGGVHVDRHPARQRLACDDQPREPGGRVLDQLPRVRAGPRPGRGRSYPAWPPSRPGPGPAGRSARSARLRAPGRGGPSRAMSLMLVAPERDRRRQRREHDRPVEQRRRAFLPQRPAQLRGQSRLVGGLAELSTQVWARLPMAPDVAADGEADFRRVSTWAISDSKCGERPRPLPIEQAALKCLYPRTDEPGPDRQGPPAVDQPVEGRAQRLRHRLRRVASPQAETNKQKPVPTLT